MESGFGSLLRAFKCLCVYAGPGPAFLFLISMFLFVCSREDPGLKIPVAGDPVTLSGRVMDENGPVKGARVRLITTEQYTVSGDEGRFTLQFVLKETPCVITAWAEGYYITGASECQPGDSNIELVLEHLSSGDNPD